MPNYDALFARLCAATGQEVRGPTMRGLQTLFDLYDPSLCELAVSEAEDNVSLPKNLYGYMKNLLRENALVADRERINREEWSAEKEDCLSSEEWKYGFGCISIMLKLAKTTDRNYQVMNDYFTTGYKKAANTDDGRNNAVLIYLKKFYATMKGLENDDVYEKTTTSGQQQQRHDAVEVVQSVCAPA